MQKSLQFLKGVVYGLRIYIPILLIRLVQSTSIWR